MVIAHRGASGYRPEHTRAAYELALELGADAFEPDVVPTKDGVLVVRHENEISQTTDVAERREFRDRRTTKTVDGVELTGWFTEDFTWEELQTLRTVERLRGIRRGNRAYDGQFPILRLSEVLNILDEAEPKLARKLFAVIEIKHAIHFENLGFDVVGLLRRELEHAGWHDRKDRIIIECFELEILRKLRSAKLASKCVFLLEDRGAPADAGSGETPAKKFSWYLSRAGLRFLEGKVDGISIQKSVLLKPRCLLRAPGTSIVDRAAKRGLEVYVWTLRPENVFLERRHRLRGRLSGWGRWQDEFARVMTSGVAGVFADQPDLAVAVRTVSAGGILRRGDTRNR